MIVDDPIRLSWPRVSLNGRHPSSGRDAGLETPIGFNAAAMSSAYYAMSSVHPIIDSHCAAILLQNHNLRRNRRAVIFVDLIGRELFDSPWRNPSTCRNKHPPHCSPWPRTTKDAVFFFFSAAVVLELLARVSLQLAVVRISYHYHGSCDDLSVSNLDLSFSI